MKLIVVGNCDGAVAREQELSERFIHRKTLESDSGVSPIRLLKLGHLVQIHWDFVECLRHVLCGADSHANPEDMIAELNNFKNVSQPRFVYCVSHAVEFASHFSKGKSRSATFMRTTVSARRIDTEKAEHSTCIHTRLTVGDAHPSLETLLRDNPAIGDRSVCSKILKESTASAYQEDNAKWAFAYMAKSQLLTANYGKLAAMLKEKAFLDGLFSQMRNTAVSRNIYVAAFKEKA